MLWMHKDKTILSLQYGWEKTNKYQPIINFINDHNIWSLIQKSLEHASTCTT